MLKKYTIIALGALFITSQANGMSYLRRLLWGSPVVKVENLIQVPKIESLTQVANGVFLKTIQHPLMQDIYLQRDVSKEKHLELIRDVKAFYAFSNSKMPLNAATEDLDTVATDIWRACSNLKKELPVSPKTARLYQDCEPYKSHADAYEAHARLMGLFTRVSKNMRAIESAVDKIVAGEIVE